VGMTPNFADAVRGRSAQGLHKSTQPTLGWGRRVWRVVMEAASRTASISEMER